MGAGIVECLFPLRHKCPGQSDCVVSMAVPVHGMKCSWNHEIYLSEPLSSHVSTSANWQLSQACGRSFSQPCENETVEKADRSDSPLVFETFLAFWLSLVNSSPQLSRSPASSVLDPNEDVVLKSHACFCMCLVFEKKTNKNWTNSLFEKMWALYQSTTQLW